MEPSSGYLLLISVLPCRGTPSEDRWLSTSLKDQNLRPAVYLASTDKLGISTCHPVG